MLFRFKRPRRQWNLRYTFVYNGSEVLEEDRFHTRVEAEDRFQAMRVYHAKQQQAILRAQLAGPDGSRYDLLVTTTPGPSSAQPVAHRSR